MTNPNMSHTDALLFALRATAIIAALVCVRLLVPPNDLFKPLAHGNWLCFVWGHEEELEYLHTSYEIDPQDRIIAYEDAYGAKCKRGHSLGEFNKRTDRPSDESGVGGRQLVRSARNFWLEDRYNRQAIPIRPGVDVSRLHRGEGVMLFTGNTESYHWSDYYVIDSIGVDTLYLTPPPDSFAMPDTMPYIEITYTAEDAAWGKFQRVQ
ncbi:hypothetical protein LEM8419_03578 [Neolewinella maritima]|uniref:Uncharacterized protein n=1 Tax=Neolewinella maritima TaxID=1383882 RepID=A0ABN8FC12_9BACT|nr:hypothetical protein LEM8419_03578 [Neolewinella maritima]